MPDPRPLNVRVADALGWTDLAEGPPPLPGEPSMWMGRPPEAWPPLGLGVITGIDYESRTLTINSASVPDFEHCWSDGGPLIERLHVDLRWVGPIAGTEPMWVATVWIPNPRPRCVRHGDGSTPLVALCNMILSLEHEGLIGEVLASAAVA